MWQKPVFSAKIVTNVSIFNKVCIGRPFQSTIISGIYQLTTHSFLCYTTTIQHDINWKKHHCHDKYFWRTFPEQETNIFQVSIFSSVSLPSFSIAHSSVIFSSHLLDFVFDRTCTPCCIIQPLWFWTIEVWSLNPQIKFFHLLE